MKIIHRFLNYLKIFKTKYYLKSKGIDIELKKIILEGDSSLHISDTAEVSLENNIKIRDCKIFVGEHAKLIIGEGTTLIGARIDISTKSSFKIDKYVLIEKIDPYKLIIYIENGSAEVGQHTRLRCSMRVRFGGVLRIGKWTFINEGSEIRCEQSVIIGDYSIISYQVDIFDTNTHPTDWKKRHSAILSNSNRILTAEERPETKPVVIGNDCWIGKKAAILKGVTIGDKAIIGLGAVVTSSVPEGNIAYGNPAKCKKRGEYD